VEEEEVFTELTDDTSEEVSKKDKRKQKKS
jgi:hypothetical protein